MTREKIEIRDQLNCCTNDLLPRSSEHMSYMAAGLVDLEDNYDQAKVNDAWADSIPRLLRQFCPRWRMTYCRCNQALVLGASHDVSFLRKNQFRCKYVDLN